MCFSNEKILFFNNFSGKFDRRYNNDYILGHLHSLGMLFFICQSPFSCFSESAVQTGNLKRQKMSSAHP